MRNPNRIYKLCNLLTRLWNIYPDLRFGQIVELIEYKIGITDLFYVEDEEIIRTIIKLTDATKS